MHTINFYPNMVPIQEMDEWFEHLGHRRRKARLHVRIWNAVYLGLVDVPRPVQGQDRMGQCEVPWEYCNAEWNSQFVGDRAPTSSMRKKRTSAGRPSNSATARPGTAGIIRIPWAPINSPTPIRSSQSISPAIGGPSAPGACRPTRPRNWAISGPCVAELKNDRKDLKVDWENLQRPGLSPDYLANRFERFDLSYERSDHGFQRWRRGPVRNNGPLLAYLGGKPARFTSKDHNFLAGETVEETTDRHQPTAAKRWTAIAIGRWAFRRP